MCTGIKIAHTTTATGKKICTPNCATLKNANPSNPAVCINSLSLTLNTCTIHPYKYVTYALLCFNNQITHRYEFDNFLVAGMPLRQSNSALSYGGGGLVRFRKRKRPK